MSIEEEDLPKAGQQHDQGEQEKKGMTLTLSLTATRSTLVLEVMSQTVVTLRF